MDIFTNNLNGADQPPDTVANKTGPNFSVVAFKSKSGGPIEIAIAPNIWLFNDSGQTKCRWPRNVTQGRCDQLVMELAAPSPRWLICKASVKSSNLSHHDAEKMLQFHIDNSDTASADETPTSHCHPPGYVGKRASCPATVTSSFLELQPPAVKRTHYADQFQQQQQPQPDLPLASFPVFNRTSEESTTYQFPDHVYTPPRPVNVSTQHASPTIAPQAQCTCNQVFQRRVLEQLENLRRQVVALTNAAIPNAIASLAIVPAKLPLESEEDLIDLEQKIEAKEDFPAMVRAVGLVEGDDVKECVSRVMLQLISKNLADKVYWKKKGSTSLYELPNVRSLIYGAVRCNAQHKDATQHDIEKRIIKWLQGSGARKPKE